MSPRVNRSSERYDQDIKEEKLKPVENKKKLILIEQVITQSKTMNNVDR
jgi:hypothetical protein